MRVTRHLPRSVVRGRLSGQDVVEYGMIIATIAIVVLIGTMTFGNMIQPWFAALAGKITTVGT
jgi:Flp pilus assembly pilin Flp